MSRTSNPRTAIFGAAVALATTMLVWAPSSASSVSTTSSPLVAVSPSRLVETRPSASTGTVDGQSFGGGRIAAGSVTSFVAAGRAGIAGDAASVVLNVTIVAPAESGFATVFPCPTGTPTAADAPNASSVNMSSGRTVANSLLVRVGVGRRVCVYTSTSAHLVVDVSGFGLGDSPVALDPARLVETRGSSIPTVDGDFTGDGRVGAGEVYRFRAVGRGGVPQDAAAVALNVAAVRPSAVGFVTIFPCPDSAVSASNAPTASNLNVVAGQNVANSAMTSVGAGGDVCVLASTAMHLVIDVNGFVPRGGEPRPFAPIRLLETRSGGGASTIDGQSLGSGRLQAGSITELQVAGRSAIEAGASAVVFNVTAISPSSPGFLTLFPCPTGRPDSSDVPAASNVNFVAGQTVANSAFVGVGAGGRICIFNSATTHLAIDASASAVDDGSPGDPPPPQDPTPPGPTPTNPQPPTVPGPQPPSTGPHAFSATVRGEPVRWDPCSTITYRVDSSRATQADVDELNSAIARVEQATGLDFVSMGDYTASYSPSSARAPRPSAPTGAEVALTFTDDDVATDFANGLLGYAIIQWSGNNGEIVQGSVTLDATPGDGVDKELVWMHELAHLVGLGHVDASGQIMQPRYDRDLTDFGNGDREGLWRVGASQPCFFSELHVESDLQTTFHPYGRHGHGDHDDCEHQHHEGPASHPASDSG